MLQQYTKRHHHLHFKSWEIQPDVSLACRPGMQQRQRGAMMKQKRVERRWIPEAFLCFDEARELIDSRESPSQSSDTVSLFHLLKD